MTDNFAAKRFPTARLENLGEPTLDCREKGRNRSDDWRDAWVAPGMGEPIGGRVRTSTSLRDASGMPPGREVADAQDRGLATRIDPP